MRTTLTLDRDVAATIERLRRKGTESLKSIINEALRRGLRQMSAPPSRPSRFETTAVDLGRCRLGSLDDVNEVLAVAESEGYR
jgi:hypothetical protein